VINEVVGRGPELQALGAFLGSLAGGSAGLVLAGSAGSGKTTLLEEAAGLAARRGFAVLHTAPARSEVRLAFAGLADLLEPRLSDVIGQLAPPQARALRVALLLEDVPPHPPEPRAIAAAFRAAIGVLVAAAPVLLVVDDVQWLDPASAATVGFVVRRLEHEPVGVLCAERSVVGGELPLELGRAKMRADVLAVGGLDTGALQRMLRARIGTSFSRPVLQRIEAVSAGNPFIAMEVGRAIVRRGGPARGGALPVPETLTELVKERLGALPGDIVEALQLVAVLPDAPADVYLAAGVATDVLDAAVAAGVLEPDAHRVRFTHPLLAAAVADAVPPGRKRELHEQAAALVRFPEERARHRALAAAAPSRQVARELADAAQAAAARGAPVIAAELFGLAASLTPADEPAAAARRELDAARNLALAGEMGAAIAALEQLADSAPPGADRADALSQLGLLHERDYPLATRLMERALAEARDDPARTADIRLSFADILSIRGHADRALAVVRDGLADAERAADPSLLATALAQCFQLSVMHGRRGEESMLRRARDLEPASGSLHLRTVPSWVAGWYHTCLGRFDEAEKEYSDLLRRAESDGVEYWRAHALRGLAHVATLRGDAHRASDLAAEGLEIAEQLDFPRTAATLLYASAYAALQLGLADAVAEQTGRGLKLAEQADDLAFVLLHRALPGSLQLALGDSAAAAARLRVLVGQVAVAGLRPTLQCIAADAAEALIAVGEPDQAAVIVAELDGMPGPVAAALATRCRGLLAAAAGDGDAAVSLLTHALDLHEQASPMPLERGRTLLALGRTLRRRGRRADARVALAEAAEAFDAITAPLWGARAREELARISGRAPGSGSLSATELRVAELVARGLSNRQVAAELFVTVRTVESTLTKTYAKLGVRSRTELAAWLRPR
jgi:DNA-binding CsgD family transcriptional regulator